MNSVKHFKGLSEGQQSFGAIELSIFAQHLTKCVMKAYAGFGASPGAELIYCGRLRGSRALPLWLLAFRSAAARAAAAVHGQIIFFEPEFTTRWRSSPDQKEPSRFNYANSSAPRRAARGAMKLKASKTITVHDVTMDEIHSRILHALKGETSR